MAASTVISEALLNRLRNDLKGYASYGRYKIGSNWYRTEIYTASVQDNGSVHISFYVERQDGNRPATEFQVYDANGNVLVSRTEEVSFAQYVDRMLIRFKLGVVAGEG